jgi:hypothetical protein
MTHFKTMKCVVDNLLICQNANPLYRKGNKKKEKYCKCPHALSKMPEFH